MCHVPLTHDYDKCLRVLENLEIVNGTTPTAEGLQIAFDQLKNAHPIVLDNVKVKNIWK